MIKERLEGSFDGINWVVITTTYENGVCRTDKNIDPNVFKHLRIAAGDGTILFQTKERKYNDYH